MFLPFWCVLIIGQFSPGRVQDRLEVHLVQDVERRHRATRRWYPARGDRRRAVVRALPLRGMARQGAAGVAARATGRRGEVRRGGPAGFDHHAAQERAGRPVAVHGVAGSPWPRRRRALLLTLLAAPRGGAGAYVRRREDSAAFQRDATESSDNTKQATPVVCCCVLTSSTRLSNKTSLNGQKTYMIYHIVDSE